MGVVNFQFQFPRLWGSCWTSPPAVFPEAAAATWDVNPRALTEIGI